MTSVPDPMHAGATAVAERDATSIRPFTFGVTDEEVSDLRRRVSATRWPDRETDPSQGVRLATIQALATLLGDRVRLARVRAALRGAAALRHRDRRRRYALHPRSLEARGRAALGRHARLARLDGRAAEDHRTAHRSHGPRRERRGRLPSRDPVVAGPRLLRQADRDRLGPDPDRARLGRPDGAPRIRPFRRAGRRLGECRHRTAGAAEARRVAGHPHQHAGDAFARDLEGGPVRRTGARRPVG